VPSLLQILQALEVELHHPDVRRNPARLAQLPHPEFHEVGRSGRMYNRESIMELLATQDSQFELVSDPDGHFNFPHLWPVKLPHGGRSNYDDSAAMAMRAAASLSR
jgi:hypothetical protein